MTERWLPVVGWEGYYEVSDMGRVRSVDRIIHHPVSGLVRRRGRILSQAPNHKGYLNVALCRDSGKVTRFAHRLVLESFVGPRPTGMQCCHSNDIHDDNRLENLRWDTPSSNAHEKVRNGRHHLARVTHCSTCELPYDLANTYRTPSGSRSCRNCRNRRTREYRIRKRNQTRRAA